MRRAFVVSAIALGSALVGCVLVASSSSDYKAPDRSCMSAADCPSDGGMQLCCVTYTPSAPANQQLGSACSPTPCGVFPQLCLVNNECSGSACTTQRCAVDGGAILFNACGIVTCPGGGQLVTDASVDSAVDSGQADGADAAADVTSQ